MGYIGVITHLPTIHPNFQPDIQVRIPKDFPQKIRFTIPSSTFPWHQERGYRLLHASGNAPVPPGVTPCIKRLGQGVFRNGIYMYINYGRKKTFVGWNVLIEL